MPTIINPYANDKTMGADLFGIGGIADAFFGPKASTAALTREKFKEQQRQNEATLALPGAIIAGNQDDIVRYGIGAGLTPANTYGYQQGRGVSQPGVDLTTPQGQQTVSTLQMAVPGTSFSSTPLGQAAQIQKAADTELAKTQRLIEADRIKDDSTFVNVRSATNPLGYETITRGEAKKRNLQAPGSVQELTSQDLFKSGIAGGPSGYTAGFPGQNASQGVYLGTAPKDDDTYNWKYTDPTTGRVFTGFTNNRRTDALSGQDIPVGSVLHKPGAGAGLDTTSSGMGKTQLGNIDESIIAGEESLALVKQIIPMVQAQPHIVGPTGNILRAGQNATDAVVALHNFFGGPDKVKLDIAAARQEAERYLGPNAAKAIPGLYNNDLNKIETLHGLLTYKLARALNKGGTLSNIDVDRARALSGTPDSWYRGSSEFLGRMSTVQSELERELADNKTRRQTQRSSVAPGATGAPGASAAPGGGTTSTGVPWTVGP